MYCTSPTPIEPRAIVGGVMLRMLRRGGNHEKMWRSRNFYHENFQSWDFQQFHENFEPRKFGVIRYFSSSVTVTYISLDTFICGY